MIGEALDAGVVGVGAVASLVMFVALGATAWANLRNGLRDVMRLLRGEPGDRKGSVLHRLEEIEDEQKTHRHDDRNVQHYLELRLGRVEQVLGSDLTPIPQPQHPSGPHRVVRSSKPDEST